MLGSVTSLQRLRSRLARLGREGWWVNMACRVESLRPASPERLRLARLWRPERRSFRDFLMLSTWTSLTPRRTRFGRTELLSLLRWSLAWQPRQISFVLRIVLHLEQTRAERPLLAVSR